LGRHITQLDLTAKDWTTAGFETTLGFLPEFLDPEAQFYALECSGIFHITHKKTACCNTPEAFTKKEICEASCDPGKGSSWAGNCCEVNAGLQIVYHFGPDDYFAIQGIHYTSPITTNPDQDLQFYIVCDEYNPLNPKKPCEDNFLHLQFQNFPTSASSITISVTGYGGIHQDGNAKWSFCSVNGEAFPVTVQQFDDTLLTTIPFRYHEGWSYVIQCPYFWVEWQDAAYINIPLRLETYAILGVQVDDVTQSLTNTIKVMPSQRSSSAIMSSYITPISEQVRNDGLSLHLFMQFPPFETPPSSNDTLAVLIHGLSFNYTQIVFRDGERNLQWWDKITPNTSSIVIDDAFVGRKIGAEGKFGITVTVVSDDNIPTYGRNNSTIPITGAAGAEEQFDSVQNSNFDFSDSILSLRDSINSLFVNPPNVQSQPSQSSSQSFSPYDLLTLSNLKDGVKSNTSLQNGLKSNDVVTQAQIMWVYTRCLAPNLFYADFDKLFPQNENNDQHDQKTPQKEDVICFDTKSVIEMLIYTPLTDGLDLHIELSYIKIGDEIFQYDPNFDPSKQPEKKLHNPQPPDDTAQNTLPIQTPSIISSPQQLQSLLNPQTAVKPSSQITYQSLPEPYFSFQINDLQSTLSTLQLIIDAPYVRIYPPFNRIIPLDPRPDNICTVIQMNDLNPPYDIEVEYRVTSDSARTMMFRFPNDVTSIPKLVKGQSYTVVCKGRHLVIDLVYPGEKTDQQLLYPGEGDDTTTDLLPVYTLNQNESNSYLKNTIETNQNNNVNVGDSISLPAFVGGFSIIGIHERGTHNALNSLFTTPQLTPPMKSKSLPGWAITLVVFGSIFFVLAIITIVFEIRWRTKHELSFVKQTCSLCCHTPICVMLSYLCCCLTSEYRRKQKQISIGKGFQDQDVNGGDFLRFESFDEQGLKSRQNALHNDKNEPKIKSKSHKPEDLFINDDINASSSVCYTNNLDTNTTDETYSTQTSPIHARRLDDGEDDDVCPEISTFEPGTKTSLLNNNNNDHSFGLLSTPSVSSPNLSTFQLGGSFKKNDKKTDHNS
jgi:hypothetical protein